LRLKMHFYSLSYDNLVLLRFCSEYIYSFKRFFSQLFNDVLVIFVIRFKLFQLEAKI
jgi:hypothetical protein